MVSSRVLDTFNRHPCKVEMQGINVRQVGLKYCRNTERWAAERTNKVVITIENIKTVESTW